MNLSKYVGKQRLIVPTKEGIELRVLGTEHDLWLDIPAGSALGVPYTACTVETVRYDEATGKLFATIRINPMDLPLAEDIILMMLTYGVPYAHEYQSTDSRFVVLSALRSEVAFCYILTSDNGKLVVKREHQRALDSLLKKYYRGSRVYSLRQIACSVLDVIDVPDLVKAIGLHRFDGQNTLFSYFGHRLYSVENEFFYSFCGEVHRVVDKYDEDLFYLRQYLDDGGMPFGDAWYETYWGSKERGKEIFSKFKDGFGLSMDQLDCTKIVPTSKWGKDVLLNKAMDYGLIEAYELRGAEERIYFFAYPTGFVWASIVRSMSADEVERVYTKCTNENRRVVSEYGLGRSNLSSLNLD